MKDKRFIGSNLALALGIVMILGGAAQPILFIAGAYTTIGALAYKSAKKKKLGIVPATNTRLILELIGIAAIVISTILTNKEMLVNDPFPNLVIPAWAVIAYVFINLKTAKSAVQ